MTSIRPILSSLLFAAACADDVSGVTGEESSSSTGDDTNATVTMTTTMSTSADTSTTDDSMTMTGTDTTDPSSSTDPTTESSSTDPTESSSSTDPTDPSSSSSDPTTDTGSSDTGSSDTGSSDTGSSSTGVTAICGNDIIEDTEVCDGTDVGVDTCVSHDFDGGTLGCLPDCTDFDETACFVVPDCVQEDLGSAIGTPVTTGNTGAEVEVLAQSCAAGGAVDHVMHWVAPSDAFWTFDTVNSGYDTALSLYTDCDAATEFACDDDAGGNATSRISRYLTAGTQVVIAVSGFAGNTGDWELNINALDLPDNSCCAPSFNNAGCNDAACMVGVCTADPFCCDGQWHDGCAAIAQGFCDVCAPDICGNGVVEAGEECDLLDFGAASCADFGQGGVLTCNQDCTIDNSSCTDFGGTCCAAHPQPGCNDLLCQQEICDFDPSCCQQWHEGCSNLANGFCDVCNTANVCGNNLTEAGEVCDGLDTEGETCQSQGSDFGQLQCLDDCSGLDDSFCSNYDGDCCAPSVGPGCEDQPCWMEVCAIDAFCCDVEWHQGCSDLAATNCAACFVPNVCGNGLAEAGNDEACDGNDFFGEDCGTLGYNFGTLSCFPDCSGVSESNCENSDCCTNHGFPGCDDQTCQDTVCAMDPFCCDVGWDGACANNAAFNCGDLCTP